MLPVLPVRALLFALLMGRALEAADGSPAPAIPEPANSGDRDLTSLPGLDGSRGKAPLSDLFARVEPVNDLAWTTEVFSDIAGGQLKKLAECFHKAGELSSSLTGPLATDDFDCDGLRPTITEVFRDGSLTVRRAAQKSGTPGTPGKSLLHRRLMEWAAIYPAGSEIHTKFKTVRVGTKRNVGETVSYVQSWAATPHGIIQQSATWTCQWRGDKPNDPPALTGIKVADYEEVLPAALAGRTPPAPPAAGKSAPLLFQDCSEALLAKMPAWKQDLVYGADHWYGTMDVNFGIHQGNHGVSIVDIDGDGREDVFLGQPAGLPNRMLHRMEDGTLEDVSAESGLDWMDNTRAAAFTDLDNDNDADAVIVLGYHAVLFENDGHGHFRERSVIDMFSWPSSIAIADYDNDGDPDIYLCGYNPRGDTAPGDIFANPVPYHDANNGARNFMIENTGPWEFRDSTKETGLDMNNRKYSFAAVWEDYDNDGDQDIYVANDFGTKNLYRNDLIKDGKKQKRPQFTDVAAEAGVLDMGAGMSVAWADYNHDGLMDIYTSNMFSSAGNRIASQDQFKSREPGESRQGFLRHARGNSLFKNLGNGKFEDVSESAGVTLGRWAWASLFLDFNNDSWDDIFVTNGFFTTPDTGDL